MMRLFFSKPTLAAAALLLAGTLFLTACGNDAGSAAPTAAPPPETSAATPASPQAQAQAPTSGQAQAQTQPQDQAPAAPANVAAGNAEPISVVAGNAVLADLARQVGGDLISVHILVPTGSDVHSWQSTPRDSVRIAEAGVVISNGAGLATQVEALFASAASPDAVVVVASDGLQPQELVELPFPGDDHDDHDDDHADGDDDDHADGDDDDHADGDDDDHADGDDDDHADGDDDDHADGDDDHADGDDDDHADGDDDDHADGDDDDHADGDDDDHADGDDDHADGDDDHADGDDDHADGDDDHADGDDDHGDDDHGDDDHGHGHGAGDPHFWQNPRMAVHYVGQIADGFAAADPGNAAVYRDNAAAYIAELEALDAYIAAALADIPAERRVLVTFHDAFGYFGTRYDLEVAAFVPSHAGDVSPNAITNVLALVQERGLPAVFAEQQFSADALNQVARDTGVSVGIIRSLPDAEHSTYAGMMRANADALAALLR